MKYTFIFVLLFNIHAKAQNGKVSTNPQDLKAVQISTKDIINPKLNEYADFYIVSRNKIFGKVLSSKAIDTIDDINSSNAIRWTIIKNTDGTVSICDRSELTKKLIETSDWATILAAGDPTKRPGAGSSTLATARNTKALFLDTSTRITAANLVNRWYLNKIAGELHWLVYPNKTDSFQIRILQKSNVPLNNVNWNFTDLSGWELQDATSTNNAFVGQPSRINRIPFYTTAVVPNMPLGGSYWQGIEDKFFSYATRTSASLINTSRSGDNKWAAPDESKIGVLLSKPFMVSTTNINFKIGGTENLVNNRVEIFMKLPANEAGAISFSDGYYKLINTFTGHNNDITRAVSISLSDAFKVFRIKITDNLTTGHILVADFSFNDRVSNQVAPAAPIIAANKPIWGTIDMHTHPMSYLGMGGKLMHGKLDGDPNIALGNCNEIHGGFGLTDNINGNFIRAEIVNMVDESNKASNGGNQFQHRKEDGKIPHHDHPHDGYPALVNWPLQTSMIHQQMWYEWLQRANQGGLKAIIALTINSELLAIALDGKGPTADDASTNDKETANRQINEIIAFVGRHADFLGIARNPTEMRSVINSGRMAIIIGMEIDNIGNFYANSIVSNEQIRAEITRLKSLGVSYIFPIHVVDNKFGGSAAYKDLFNYSNKYATGKHILGNSPASSYPPVLPGNLMTVEHAEDPRIGFHYPKTDHLEIIGLRTLVEFIETAPANPIISLNPLLAPLIPNIIQLSSSNQFQTLKRYYLDLNAEAVQYDTLITPAGHRNVMGLTPQGEFAIREMMRQGMMIDVDHASEKSVNRIIEIAEANNYPVNSGHNGLRGTNDNEKTRTREQLTRISRLGGMFGMGWENQTPTTFKNNYNLHSDAMGNINTTFGSDIDGYAATPKKVTPPIGRPSTISGEPNIVTAQELNDYENRKVKYTGVDALLKYTMPGSRSWDFNVDGMAHIGLVPDFFEALKRDGMTMEKLNLLFLSAENFAQMWEKCEARAPLVER